MERKTFSPCPYCNGRDNNCADCEVQAYRALGTVEELTRGAALREAQDEGRVVNELLVYRCPDDCLRMVSDSGDYFTPPFSECEVLGECERLGADFVSDREDTNAPPCPWYLSLETVEKIFWAMHEGEKLVAYAEAEAAQREEGQDG